MMKPKMITAALALLMTSGAAQAEVFVAMTCFKHFDPKWSGADGCNNPRNNPWVFKTAEECEQLANSINSNPPRSKTQTIIVKCFKTTVPVTVFEPTEDDDALEHEGTSTDR